MTTMTAAELRARVETATIPVGKAHFAFATASVPSYGQVYLRHPSEDSWFVLAVWPIPEGFDDDSGSFNCGCPLARTSHAHQQFGPTADRGEATTVWVAWTTRLLNHQTPVEEG